MRAGTPALLPGMGREGVRRPGGAFPLSRGALLRTVRAMTPNRRRDFLSLKTPLLAVLAAAALAPLTVCARSEAPVPVAAPALVSGLAKAGTPEALPTPEAERGALKFLVMGDWGWVGIGKRPDARPGEDEENRVKTVTQVVVARAMGEFAAARPVSFVVGVGDNFYPAGVKSTDDPRWKQTFEDVYSAPSLQVPWWHALGNHDYRGSVQAQIDYSKKSSRWRMPARYFTFSEKSPAGVTVQLFVLDTSPFAPGLHNAKHSDVAAQDTGAQLAWLERELAASKADWKILVGHHPLWTGGVRREAKETELAQILPPLMRRHGVAVYLCGHEHDAQHIERDGLHNFIVGNAADASRPTGATAGTRYADIAPGFARVSVDAERLRVDYVDASGAVRHTARIERPVGAVAR